MDSVREEEKEMMMMMGGPKDLTHIVKGKRTKRQRPQSPIPFTITTHSSTGPADNYNINNNINSSPANSANTTTTTTDEDEDTAKCLILLSQGPSPESPNIIMNYNHNEEELGTYKFNSKRYIETSTTGNGKAGIYVYECKTCNRTFPSFQALGGHRASHKKPKAAAPEDRKRPSSFMALSDEEEPQVLKHNYTNNNISSALSLQLSNRPTLYNNNSNSKSCSKVHECAICGAEFTSGQALGGHMRRHRGPVVAAGGGGANMTLSLSPSSPPIGIDEESKKAKNGLCLDLNLPAAPEPEEEPVNVHNRESTTATNLGYNSSKQQNQTSTTHHQQQQQQKQQSPLVLSAAPTLVDCHY